VQPDLEEERWEYFHHPDKQRFYIAHGIEWDFLVNRFAQGELVGYPRSATLEGVTVSGAYHAYEDYAKYLARAKRGYRINYSRMEDDLQATGSLTLKAPIILMTLSEGLLFSGYRRLCLAWNHGMVPYVWKVQLEPASDGV
jgi:hypothetical protein